MKGNLLWKKAAAYLLIIVLLMNLFIDHGMGYFLYAQAEEAGPVQDEGNLVTVDETAADSTDDKERGETTGTREETGENELTKDADAEISKEVKKNKETTDKNQRDKYMEDTGKTELGKSDKKETSATESQKTTEIKEKTNKQTRSERSHLSSKKDSKLGRSESDHIRKKEVEARDSFGLSFVILVNGEALQENVWYHASDQFVLEISASSKKEENLKISSLTCEANGENISLEKEESHYRFFPPEGRNTCTVTAFMEDGRKENFDFHIQFDKTAPKVKDILYDHYNREYRNGNTLFALWDEKGDEKDTEEASIDLSFRIEEEYLKEDTVFVSAEGGRTTGKDFEKESLRFYEGQDHSEGKLSQSEDGTYTLTFCKNGTWRFRIYAEDRAGNLVEEYIDETRININDSKPELKVIYKKVSTEEGKFLFTNRGKNPEESDWMSAVIELRDEAGISPSRVMLYFDGHDQEHDQESYSTEKGVVYRRTIWFKAQGIHHFFIGYTSRNGLTLRDGDISEEAPAQITLDSGDSDHPVLQGEHYSSRKIIVDWKDPILTDVSIDDWGEHKNQRAGHRIFLDNDTKAKLKLSCMIDEDHLYDPSVTISVEMGSEKVTWNGDDLERNFKRIFNIDDFKDVIEGDYYVTVDAKDKAGNPLTLSAPVKSMLESTRLVVDRTAPEMTITYQKPVNRINGSKRLLNNTNELFYRKKSDIIFSLKEKNYIPGKSEEDIRLEVKTKKTDEEASYHPFTIGDLVFENKETGIMSSSGDNNDYWWTYSLSDLPYNDSHSYFTIAYTDFSGNRMRVIRDNGDEGDNEGIGGEEYGKDGGDGEYGIVSEEGIYTSPVITVDNTKPVIETDFSGSSVCSHKKRHYYQKEQTMTIKVTEENFNPVKDGVAECSVFDFSDEVENQKENQMKNYTIQWRQGYTYVDGKKQFIGSIQFKDEWNYNIRTKAKDLSQLKAEDKTDGITIDGTKPFISIQDKENTSESDVIFYRSMNTRDMAGFFDYRRYGYFHKDLVRVKITAHDKISGLCDIKYAIIHDKGGVTRGKWHFDAPKGKQTVFLTIPKDTKDHIKIKPKDYAQMTGDIANPRGVVTETADYHRKHSSIKIKVITKPANIVGTMKYYNTDVKALITMEDGQSGIKSYEYTAGTVAAEKHDYSLEAGSLDKKGNPRTELVYKKSVMAALAAGDINYSSTTDPTGIKVSFTDHAGHESAAEEKLVIDDKKPVIKVNWSSTVEPMNQKYYKAARTAAITVHERNFDESRIKWKIKNSAGVEISKWSHHGDDHICTVSFTQDGDDYLLDFDMKDLADNAASCPVQEPFTIDKTAPVISVTFDNNHAANGNYYNKARTAILHVQEHNFRPEDIIYNLSGRKEGKSISSPMAGKWSADGDRHRTEIHYGSDGTFRLNFEYTDLAGNSANKIITEEFTIDLTSPVVKILGIEDHNAYNDKVMPVVEYSDINLEEKDISISLTGNKTGIADYDTFTPDKIQNGRRIRWKDFPRTKEVDDIYTLDIKVKDKAGNVNNPGKVVFSVNRFGSSYIYGRQTEELVNSERPYFRIPVPIEITEINVSGLKEKAVSVRNEDNEIFSLKEGEDYKITQHENEYKWKEYTYDIYAKNFEEEGQYSVTVSSMDHASNLMTNLTRQKQIDFVIDQTKPAGSISGLEEERYLEDQHEIYIRADDNYGLKEAVLYVNNAVKKIYTAEDFESEEGVKEMLCSSNAPQKVFLELTDWAGNKNRVFPDEDAVLITSNRWVQLYHYKLLFRLIITGGIVLALFTAGILISGLRSDNSTDKLEI